MRTLNTGEPCPCCGMPIQLTDPEALRMLAMVADLLGLPEMEGKENSPGDHKTEAQEE